MSKSVKITVATVCYNAASTIKSTIESVLCQDYDNVEYVVIDGASTDGTIDILKLYEERLVLVSEKDNGVYDAMNKALNIACGDYLLFLGADDLLADSMILSRIAVFLRNQNAVYYGNVRRVRRNDIYAGCFNKWDWGYKNLCHQSIFYPKSIYKRFKYELKYKLAADWVYNLTLLKHSTSFVYMNEVVAIYNNIDGLSSTYNDNAFLSDRRKLVVDAVGFIPYVYGVACKIFKKLL